jgi:hypothetical protein
LIRRTPELILLLDIDGVLNESQRPITDTMRMALSRMRIPIYFVTGNTFTKSVDLLNWHAFAGLFSNNADELRDRFGYKLWEDDSSPLPKDLGRYLEAVSIGARAGNNTIEWRSPRFVNYSLIGRFATNEERKEHNNDWRDRFIERITNHFDVQAVKGGSISVDIFMKGADKSRACKHLAEPFIFIGDKTSKGGNDYPVVEYATKSGDYAFTSTGPDHTMELLDKILREEYDQIPNNLAAS